LYIFYIFSRKPTEREGILEVREEKIKNVFSKDLFFILFDNYKPKINSVSPQNQMFFLLFSE